MKKLMMVICGVVFIFVFYFKSNAEAYSEEE